MDKTHRKRPPRTNEQWRATVGDMLGGDARAREAARAMLWQEVHSFLLHAARLPIGPLNEDSEARSDIALRVLEKLEANSCAHLAEWLARQQRKRDHASFWGWVTTVARSIAIDHARTSRRNVARRGEPFRWIRVECVDPLQLGEAIGSPRSYLACGSDQAIEEFLADAQFMLRDDDASGVALIERR